MNRVNVNDFVYVVPTEDGAKVYNDDIARRNIKLPKDLHRQQIAAGEILKIQLWSLMQIFGPRMVIVGPTLFEHGDVFIDVKDAIQAKIAIQTENDE